MTPLFKRIRKERMSLAGGPRGNSLAMPLDVKRKRRSSNFKDIHEIPEVQVLQEIQVLYIVFFPYCILVVLSYKMPIDN